MVLAMHNNVLPLEMNALDSRDGCHSSGQSSKSLPKESSPVLTHPASTLTLTPTNRKSYRKVHKNKAVMLIPFRKAHDNFEGRIITTLNKICSNTCTNKDI